MKNLFVLLIFISTCFYAQAQWKVTNINSGRNLDEVFLPSERVIYIASSDGPIIRSTDGGANWDSLFTVSLSTKNSLVRNNIWFVSDSTGFLTTKGMLYKTDNMGNSWTDITPDTNIHTITSLQFTSEHRGYFYSYRFSQGDIWITDDGGQTWSKSLISYPGGSGTSHLPYSTFVSDSIGYFTGGDGTFLYRGVISKTTDGGKNWDTLVTFGQYSLVEFLQFTHTDTGYAVSKTFGDIRTLYKTADGGQTWDSVTAFTALDGIFFRNSEKGYSTNSAGMSVTNNGGESWSTEFVTKKEINLTSFHCAGNLCYAVGDSGNIAVLDQTNSIASSHNSNRNVSVYPNPSPGHFNFSIPYDGTAEFQIYNTAGEAIVRIQVIGNFTVDLNKYPAGVYIYRLVNQNKIAYGKIIKH